MSQNQLSDTSIIILLWRMCQQDRINNKELQPISIQLTQKMLRLSIDAIIQKKMIATPFNFTQELCRFIQNINKMTMEIFNKNIQETKFDIFIKAVNVLLAKDIHKIVEPKKKLGQLKILTFNNLACIYKRQNLYKEAIKAISYSLQIEQELVKEGQLQQQFSILTTYINKSAIFSEMKKHSKALDQLKKTEKIIDKIDKTIEKYMSYGNEQKKANIQQKIYNKKYMQMIINYNMGIQTQLIGMNDCAYRYFKKGKKIAVDIQNQYMLNKFNEMITQYQ